MMYWRCKCGKSEAWGDYPPRCSGCPDCGTTLDGHPDHHKTPEPHMLVVRYHERTGKPYQRCTQCLQRFGYKEAGIADVSENNENAKQQT